MPEPGDDLKRLNRVADYMIGHARLLSGGGPEEHERLRVLARALVDNAPPEVVLAMFSLGIRSKFSKLDPAEVERLTGVVGNAKTLKDV